VGKSNRHHAAKTSPCSYIILNGVLLITGAAKKSLCIEVHGYLSKKQIPPKATKPIMPHDHHANPSQIPVIMLNPKSQTPARLSLKT